MSSESAAPHPDPALFVIRHALEIEGSAETTWGVLSDLARYSEWNPYVLALKQRRDLADRGVGLGEGSLGEAADPPAGR